MINAICIVLGLAIPALIYIYNKKWIAYYLIATCFLTEFYYINIVGGKIRFYHLAAIVVILVLYKYWKQLLQRFQVKVIAFFVGYALVSALISNSRSGAVKSWCSLVLNVCVAVAILLVLQAQYITLEKLKQVICYLVILECILGIVQYFMFFMFRINIGFSWEQQSQINIGMIPAFRTEANVFGRSLLIMMFLLLPDLVYKQTKIAGLYVMYVLGTFCTMINMTRTVLYPAVVVVIALGIYFIRKGYGVRFGKLMGSFVVLVVGIVILAHIHVLPVAEYTTYKWSAFVSPLKIDTNMLVADSGESVNVEEVEQGKVETYDETVKEYYQQQMEESKELSKLEVGKTQEVEKTEVENTESLVEEKEYNVKEVESTYDVSSSYRMSNTIKVLKSMLESPRIFIFGRGWGQTYFMINKYASQAGAGDWGNVFAYTGILGFMVYLFVTINTLKIVFIEVVQNKKDIILALGILSSCIILGVAGLLSSNIIMPDFWMLIGMAAYMEKKNEKA